MINRRRSRPIEELFAGDVYADFLVGALPTLLTRNLGPGRRALIGGGAAVAPFLFADGVERLVDYLTDSQAEAASDEERRATIDLEDLSTADYPATFLIGAIASLVAGRS